MFGVATTLNMKKVGVERKQYQLKNILKDIINNLKKSDTCKIQSTLANNFISSTDNDKE